MPTIQMENLIGVNQGHDEILGKFLYYSLSNVLIDREKLLEICESMNLPVKPGSRVGALDAFKSATGEVYDRIVKKDIGGLNISKVYCRDNQNSDKQYSRELVREILGETTNRYKKLANICYDREYERFSYSVDSYEPDIDIYGYCDKAVDAFELHKRCAGRNQIETMAEAFLSYMEALKISIRGRLFFIPKKSMHLLEIFEDFIEAVGKNNQRGGELTINSMHVIDDARQRDKMSAEFYNATRKEIELYTEKIEYLISSGSQSPAVMDRWALKIQRLDEKKHHYESLLKRELSDLDDQYGTLKFLAQELSARVNKIKLEKCA